MTKSKNRVVIILAVVMFLAFVAATLLALSTAGIFEQKSGNSASAVADQLNTATDEEVEAFLDEKFDFYLNASDMEFASITETTEAGTDNKFILGAVDKNFVVDANAKFGFIPKADDPEDAMIVSFTRRLKQGGVSDLATQDRTISFYLEQKAKIYVFAISASSSDNTRKVSLGKSGVTEAVASEFVLPTATYYDPIVFETTEAGSYYLYTDVGAINFYFIGVEYTGEATGSTDRASWESASTPSITSAILNPDDPKSVFVDVSYNISNDGGDFVYVYMKNAAGERVAKKTLLKYGTSGRVKFIPAATDTYTFEAELSRQGETSKKLSAASTPLDFTLVLEKASVRARTIENNKMLVTVTAVAEADDYILNYKEKTSAAEPTVIDLDIANLVDGELAYELQLTADDIGKAFDFKIIAKRGTESAAAGEFTAILRNTVERDWAFSAFGQSTSTSKNIMTNGGNIFDGVTLSSCTYDHAEPDIKKATTVDKGGKFTYGAIDGISYYYTQIDASEEDFVLKSKVTVDYINPVPDGQEGFGLLVRDSIGEHGSTDLYYTNSAAAIATKIQYYSGVDRLTVTPGIGARFVTGVKDTFTTPDPTILSQKMYSLDPTEQVTTGDTFVMEVEKKNNAYFVRYYGPTGSYTGEQVVEYALYPDAEGNDQLLVCDKENVYVGFAVARGCNATFTDINFKVTPRSTETIEIKKIPLILGTNVTSPTTSSISSYNLVFYANADGVVDINLNDKSIVKSAKIDALTDYKKTVSLAEGENVFTYTFTPNADFKPEDESQELDTYEPRSGNYIVFNQYYQNKGTPIIAAPAPLGTPSGDGTKDNPLDLQTAINYVLPGQTIYLLEGTYIFTSGNVTVERGNNGSIYAYKVIRSHPDNTSRPVFDFANKGGGFTVWGNYWHLNGFDLIKTAKGKKGIQLGGSYNVLENVNTYDNGDSGVSVSGKSTDIRDKWPSYNTIYNCTSYMNFDAAEEDADGFAAKLYCGDGNRFEGCIAYCNADDGWDLYAKTESGTIGAVEIENCVAYGNGFRVDGTSTRGNGNGFKLGGESLPGKHVLRNSISFANKLKGIDTNSCPDSKVYDSISVYNGKYNFAFYTSASPTTDFDVEGVISLLGNSSDNIQIRQRSKPIYRTDNYFYYAEDSASGASARTVNVDGAKLTTSILNGYDSATGMQGYIGVTLTREESKVTVTLGNFEYVTSKITRKEDGSINMNGLFELTADAPADAGAKLQATPQTNWNTAHKFPVISIVLIILAVILLLGSAFLPIYWFVLKNKIASKKALAGAGSSNGNVEANAEVVADEKVSEEATAESTSDTENK